MNQRIINIAAYTIAVFVFFYLFLPEIVKLFEKPSGLPIVWKETVGVIDPNVYKSGKIMYYVGSNMYVSTFHHKNENAVLGEKYTMRYNINDPHMIEVDYWHPIFEPNEKTHKFRATITSIQKVIPLIHPIPAVVFVFDVVYEDNEVEHVKRYAILPMNYKQLYPNLKEGNQYIVECLEDNIYRMVLHLDKPIKK